MQMERISAKRAHLIKNRWQRSKNTSEKRTKEEGYKKAASYYANRTVQTISHKKIAEALQQMFKENLGVRCEACQYGMECFFQEEQKALKFQLSQFIFSDYAKIQLTF